ncbi:MAG: hypothetical protein WAL86_13820 [Candidatus Acidiferrales bacterium]
MTASFDIFQTDADGVRWRGVAQTLGDAKARVREIASSPSDEYLILNQDTGDKIVLNFDSEDAL